MHTPFMTHVALQSSAEKALFLINGAVSTGDLIIGEMSFEFYLTLYKKNQFQVNGSPKHLYI